MGERSDADARPVHRVQISAFEIDATEVTVKEYKQCVAAGECAALTPFGALCNVDQVERQNHPVNCVEWLQAVAFCRWAGKRLPTEEEWEYAARGSDGRTYPWGNSALEQQACWRRSVGKLGTCEVGSHLASDSPFGVHDMAGNVWEWTASALSANYAAKRNSPLRVMRGGSWSEMTADYFRATARGRGDPHEHSTVTGFRCARGAD